MSPYVKYGKLIQHSWCLTWTNASLPILTEFVYELQQVNSFHENHEKTKNNVKTVLCIDLK